MTSKPTRHCPRSLTQLKQLIARRKAGGDGGMEALRILKRRLSDIVYQALHASTHQPALTR